MFELSDRQDGDRLLTFGDHDTQFVIYPFPDVQPVQVFQHRNDVFCLPRIAYTAHQPICGIDDCLEPVQ